MDLPPALRLTAGSVIEHRNAGPTLPGPARLFGFMLFFIDKATWTKIKSS